MGSKEENAKSIEYEYPQHELELPSYWISKYLVTVAQFRAFAEATNYKFLFWQNNTIADRPIVNVNWYDAISYCEWLDRLLSAISKKSLAKNNPLWQGLADEKLHVTLPSEDLNGKKQLEEQMLGFTPGEESLTRKRPTVAKQALVLQVQLAVFQTGPIHTGSWI